MDPGNGQSMGGGGTFTEVIQDRKISYTWTWDHDPSFGGNSLVTFELFDTENPYDDDGTPAQREAAADRTEEKRSSDERGTEEKGERP